MTLITLASVPVGHPAVLTRLAADVATRRRLAELGLRVGATTRVLRRTAGGGRVVAVAGSRIALDASTAVGIEVEPVTGSSAAGHQEQEV